MYFTELLGVSKSTLSSPLAAITELPYDGTWIEKPRQLGISRTLHDSPELFTTRTGVSVNEKC